MTKPQAEALVEVLIVNGKAVIRDHPQPLTPSAAALAAVIGMAETMFKGDAAEKT